MLRNTLLAIETLAELTITIAKYAIVTAVMLLPFCIEPLVVYVVDHM